MVPHIIKSYRGIYSIISFNNKEFEFSLTLELLRSLESLLLFLLSFATSTDFSLLCDRDLESRDSRSRDPRFDDDEDFSSFKKRGR